MFHVEHARIINGGYYIYVILVLCKAQYYCYTIVHADKYSVMNHLLEEEREVIINFIGKLNNEMITYTCELGTTVIITYEVEGRHLYQCNVSHTDNIPVRWSIRHLNTH